jgi:hypothetical protein
MNRVDARKLAEILPIQDLKFMIVNAYALVRDWSKVSQVNKGMTIGATFNLLTNGFSEKSHPIVKTNLIREFGEYLPEDKKPIKRIKQVNNKVHHEDPKPLNKSFYEF